MGPGPYTLCSLSDHYIIVFSDYPLNPMNAQLVIQELINTFSHTKISEIDLTRLYVHVPVYTGVLIQIQPGFTSSVNSPKP